MPNRAHKFLHLKMNAPRRDETKKEIRLSVDQNQFKLVLSSSVSNVDSTPSTAAMGVAELRLDSRSSGCRSHHTTTAT